MLAYLHSCRHSFENASSISEWIIDNEEHMLLCNYKYFENLIPKNLHPTSADIIRQRKFIISYIENNKEIIANKLPLQYITVQPQGISSVLKILETCSRWFSTEDLNYVIREHKYRLNYYQLFLILNPNKNDFILEKLKFLNALEEKPIFTIKQNSAAKYTY